MRQRVDRTQGQVINVHSDGTCTWADGALEFEYHPDQARGLLRATAAGRTVCLATGIRDRHAAVSYGRGFVMGWMLRSAEIDPQPPQPTQPGRPL